MRTHFNFNIALVVSLAFIFRLLFVNISLLSTLNVSTSKKLNASHSSSHLKKRRRNPESGVKATFENYSNTEVCEENLDNEENTVKAGSPVLLSFLYSLCTRIITPSGTNNLFDSTKCQLYPKKYLALSILRV